MTMHSEDDCLARLNTLVLPVQLIDTLMDQHTSLTLEDKTKQLSDITTSVSHWIETIHLALFTLEQNIKQHNTATPEDTQLVDDTVQRMNPVIDSLTDLVDVMEDTTDDGPMALPARTKITKIQSEWSGLQHFLSSVKQSFVAMDEEKQLRLLMDQVLVQIEDLSLLVFQYQERRSSGLATTTTLLDLKDALPPSSSTPPSSATAATADDILVDIDNRVGPVFGDVNKIYARMVIDTPPADATGILVKRHRMIQERWECLRVEIDELKADLKEDRWLTVFKQVADQVEAMMDGLDKTVEQCQSMVQQVREWQGLQQPSSSSSSTTTVTPQHQHQQQQQQQQQYPVPPKGILRSSKSHHSSASVSSNSSSGSAGSPPPVDHIKLRSVEKNFEAKYKYCTPLITKMLSMLGENIATRVAENNATVARHQHMVQRWQRLKSSMDDLRIRDLPDIERLLVFERPISPAWSKVSDRSDKSGNSYRYKSPEPTSYDLFDYRPSTSSLGSLGGRARSPLSIQHQHQQLHQYGNNGYMSPTAQLYGMHEELRRGRSVTPSSGTGSRDHISLWRSTNGASPVHGRSLGRTTSPLSGFQDILKPSTSDTPSLDSNSTRSTMKYSTTSPALWHEDVSARQSPAPAPSRCRSRQDELPYGGRRSVTPVRRAGTPSMIPRPKTPSQDQGGMNASQIPRPRSSMLRASPSMMAPSPSSFLSSTSPPPSPPHVSKRTLNRKYSSPALNQQGRFMNDNHRLFTQTPPPPSSRQYYDFAEEDEDYFDENDDEDEDGGYMGGGYGGTLSGQQQDRRIYTPDPKDPLDVEVAKVINGNPIRIQCERGTQPGRYYFGHELNPTPGGGRKLYTCKLMTYTNRERRTNGFGVQAAHGKSTTTRKKVLTRVGGGWIDLEIFLLEHHNLMLSH